MDPEKPMIEEVDEEEEKEESLDKGCSNSVSFRDADGGCQLLFEGREENT